MPLAASQSSVTKLLPLMQFHINGIIRSVMCCVCLPSLGIMLLRFLCAVVSISRPFLSLLSGIRSMDASPLVTFHQLMGR